MNKKFVPFLGIAAAMAGGLVGCSDEQTLSVGEGTIYVSTRVNSDIVVESRAAAEEDLAASTQVWIYSDQGVVRKYNGMAEVPAGGIKLISGNYTVKAWAGTLSYASFTDRWFEGSEALTVEAGKSISCEVVCKIANVLTSVKYPENIGELISDYSLTVSHKGGSLTFEGQDDRKGYFIMPEGVTALDYVLTFTVEGAEKTVRGTIADVEPAHEYVLNIIANPAEEDETGAAWITIEVDDTMVDVEETITITPPPSITGFGFDLSAPVAGESGSIGRRSVYVAAAAPLTSVEVTGLPNCPGFEDGVNFIHATAAALEQLAALGISHEVADVDGGQLMKIVFSDEYLNSIPNSDEPYVISFTATDSTDKTSSATMTLRISEAPVVAAPVEDKDVTYLTASLTGTVAKEGVEAVGFQYAPAGSSEWTYVSGSTTRAALAKGQAFYATITGLDYGKKYQYRAVQGTADEIIYAGDILEFSTRSDAPQIANSSFEGWYTEGKVEMPVPDGSVKAWDTGNHGSSTMSVNLTQKSTDMKHSGTYSARLRSQFVGIGSIGKFAAGNLFFGKYLKTVGTNGVVGFGHEFAFPQDEIKPVALRAWINFRPA
ncbi:MAG: DUF4493 domain-containing protein, partial [Muribaculaceae bacterium]|nr:DUF4493 domain-containing protein [Muribaculaceae bacterium]